MSRLGILGGGSQAGARGIESNVDEDRDSVCDEAGPYDDLPYALPPITDHSQPSLGGSAEIRSTTTTPIHYLLALLKLLRVYSRLRLSSISSSILYPSVNAGNSSSALQLPTSFPENDVHADALCHH
ncbi:hypothetical protein SISSUDRAFT_1065111 [Sistotremastrum suecicum HHB10207 ss-3]|uniref:Uncharacterized protein n=1 Tax=Sistotremastrum suecicum HHB10207 ss-3 TaxID=1314776 RepID=A0A165ZUR9_9AGAM|nr:hypothetical protein SISSUDRAFT_1065111 [Sistotremastrum suecicum HHB10207 ss-3]